MLAYRNWKGFPHADAGAKCKNQAGGGASRTKGPAETG